MVSNSVYSRQGVYLTRTRLQNLLALQREYLYITFFRFTNFLKTFLTKRFPVLTTRLTALLIILVPVLATLLRTFRTLILLIFLTILLTLRNLILGLHLRRRIRHCSLAGPCLLPNDFLSPLSNALSSSSLSCTFATMDWRACSSLLPSSTWIRALSSRTNLFSSGDCFRTSWSALSMSVAPSSSGAVCTIPMVARTSVRR